MDHQAFAQLLGNYGEFIGAGAVVVTLIYLTLQLRQNTSAIRSSSWQAIQDSEHRFDTVLACDAKLAEIWLRGNERGLDAFDDPTERFQFHLVGKQLVDLFQTHHYQHQAGLIEDELWGTWVTQYDEQVASSPGFRDVIRERYPHLRSSFRKFVDEHPYIAQ
jgi:hypothetical protein